MVRDLAIVLALILANGLFSGAEIALLSMRKTRIAELVADGSRRAAAVEALRKNPERLFATVQIGITVLSAAAAAFAGDTMERPIEAFYQRLGAGEASGKLALATVVAGVSYLSLILGELVPKSLALRSTEAYSLMVGGPLHGLSRLTRPIGVVLTASSNVVLRFFKDSTNFSEARLSIDEIRQLIEEAADAGELDSDTRDFATRALDLRGLRVGAVMVPRPAIATVQIGASPDAVRQTLKRVPYSRLPACRDGIDDIEGYVRAMDVYEQLSRTGKLDWSSLVHPLHFYPESKLATEVLRELQAHRQPLAIIIDEGGGVAGLVTVKDLVEEIVGEILNEGERAEFSILKDPDGSALVSGRTPVREVNRELELELPDGPGFSTVGGLVLSLAGELPNKDVEFTTPDGTVLHVDQVSARRVELVRVRGSADESSAA